MKSLNLVNPINICGVDVIPSPYQCAAIVNFFKSNRDCGEITLAIDASGAAYVYADYVQMKEHSFDSYGPCADIGLLVEFEDEDEWKMTQTILKRSDFLI